PEDLAPPEEGGAGPLAELGRQATLLDRLLRDPRFEYVREAYLEGPVELLVDGERVASAGAIYVDRVAGHGWISDARYEVRQNIGGSRFRFKIEADWLRISADGTLVSNRARVTTCEHDEPHFYINTGELRLTPTGNPDFPYRVSLRDNSIQILGRFSLPLPPVSDLVDPEGRPSLGGVRVASTARFGTVLSLGYSRDLNETTRWLHDLIVGGEEAGFSSKFRVDASYLGSRGVLLDFGLRMRSQGRYFWNQNLAVVPDRGEDGGYLKVPESERDTLRLWYRSRARFDRGPGEWVDAVVTAQSDPGVQSEFFEDDYVEYEERETFVHWRKAEGALYTSASVSGTLESWRTTTEQLPEGRLVWERQPLLDLGSTALLYGLDVRGGYLDRTEGDPDYEPVYPDGLGDRDLLRVDADQRLEVPLSLGLLGLRATPFLDARLTGWSEGQAEDDDLGRAAAL
ncbi:MAG TPA: hypothetical protein VJP77_04035, partial [Planctomycetota bacterium]|nr:hypothetical protein [Planctomycetota bacterium]